MLSFDGDYARAHDARWPEMRRGRVAGTWVKVGAHQKPPQSGSGVTGMVIALMPPLAAILAQHHDEQPAIAQIMVGNGRRFYTQWLPTS